LNLNWLHVHAMWLVFLTKIQQLHNFSSLFWLW
jgi:hypothetical protein